ncbi:MAG: outer membrane lipoprotein LolB [Alteromonadaceae bacterium]|nr:outer membrane lipoprotein LolB [Alteromonadaceae bacterium]
MIRLAFVFVFVMFLTACATRPPPPEGKIDLPVQLLRLDQIKQWQINGKLALKGPEQSVSASMRWQVEDPLFTFRLSNFLGVTLVDMTQSADGARLEADDEVYTDASASALLYTTTGWDIPLAQLLSWVKGVPLPSDSYTLNDNGLLKRLIPGCRQCQGWVVDYSSYGQVEDVWLPHNIKLTNTTDANQWIKIRITQWTL